MTFAKRSEKFTSIDDRIGYLVFANDFHVFLQAKVEL